MGIFTFPYMIKYTYVTEKSRKITTPCCWHTYDCGYRYNYMNWCILGNDKRPTIASVPTTVLRVKPLFEGRSIVCVCACMYGSEAGNHFRSELCMIWRNAEDNSVVIFVLNLGCFFFYNILMKLYSKDYSLNKQRHFVMLAYVDGRQHN